MSHGMLKAETCCHSSRYCLQRRTSQHYLVIMTGTSSRNAETNVCFAKQDLEYRFGGRAGRHMLTEMVVDNYIPNDTHMTDSHGRVQVSCFWLICLATLDSQAPLACLLAIARRSCCLAATRPIADTVQT